MKAIKKTFAVILCMIMTLSMFSVLASADNTTPTTTAATIDTSKKGSITIYKYEYNGTTGTGTGETTDAGRAPLNNVTGDPTPLKDVTFDLYKVMDQTQLLNYYDGTAANSGTVKATDFIDNGKVYNYDNRTSHSTELTTKTTKTTGVDGKVEYTDLDLGMYLVIESNSPAKVTAPADPFLVSVPMTQVSSLENWLYDITVYPKNKTSVGNVTLTKEDGHDGKLVGVEFELAKEGSTAGSYTQVGDTNKTTTAAGEIKWEDLTKGNYRITEVSTNKGYIADKRPIYFTVNENNEVNADTSNTGGFTIVSGNGTKNLSLKLVNYKPDVTKTITTAGNENGKELNANIGDEVEYKLEVEVPGNITNLKTFTLTDSPTNLQYKANSIAITCPSADEGKIDLTENTHYTLETSGNGFTVTFTNAEMSDYAGKTINVTYKATVLASAKDAISAPNKATLTYSNTINPATTPGETEPEDTKYKIEDGAVVYTYQLGLTKYKDSKATGNVLENVEFELYNAATGETKIAVVEESKGTYYYTTNSTGLTTTLKTDASGKIVVKGLKNGTYYLQETKTVEGYNLLKGRVEVPLTINKTASWETTTEWTSNGVTDTITKKVFKSATYTSNDDDATTTSLYNVDVINKKGLLLPQTGGIGTAMFIVLGGVLIAVGSYMLFVRGKKRDSDF